MTSKKQNVFLKLGMQVATNFPEGLTEILVISPLAY